MPSIIQTTTGQDYNLLGTFTSDDGAGNEYDYNVPAANVKMWLNFAETPSDRSNYSSGISAITYVKDGALDLIQESSDFGGLKSYNTIMTKDDTTGNHGHVRIDFSSTTNALTFGDGLDDSAFSLSFWYNRNTTHANNTEERLFSKGDTSANKEFDLRWANSTGYFHIRLFDSANEIYTNYNLGSSYFDDTWKHIVLTYNGSENASGIKLYINGIEISADYSSTGASYVAMEGVSDKLYIGADENGNSDDGTFSEIAVFSEELSQNTVRAIYYATKDGATITTSNYYSGEVSNPTRDIIRKMDRKVRYVDDCSTKKGTYSSKFNDDNTIDFIERELVGSIGVEENTTSTPFIALNSYNNYGISLTSDFGSSFITNQTRNQFEGDIDPFRENEKFFLQESFAGVEKKSIDVIDQAGLEENTNKKDIIEIDLNPVEDTSFGIEQGVGSDAENDLMVYWNNNLKKWEKIGGTVLSPSTTGGIQGMISDGKIGFGPTEGMVIPSQNSSFQSAFKNFGLPIDNFGFPSHPKYHATGSQCIQMSNYICEPFVVEKIVYELDAKLYVDLQTASTFIEDSTPTNYTETDHLGSYFTFFILNQRNEDQVTKIQTSTFSSQEDRLYSDLFTRISDIDEDFDGINTNRDLVTYMQAVVYRNSPTVGFAKYGQFDDGGNAIYLDPHSGFLEEGYGRNINIEGTSFIDSSAAFDPNDFSFNGVMKLSGDVIEEKKHESFGINFDIAGTQYAFIDLGNKRNLENPTEALKPRCFGNGLFFDDKKKDNFFKYSHYPSLSKPAYDGITYKKSYFNNFEKPNPYVLFPEDNLVFGWQSPISLNASSLDSTNPSSQMTIKSGTGRLKLYGSFLRNKKARHANTIFYSNDMISKPIKKNVSDQYQVATRNQQEGSYNSEFTSGEMPNRVAVSRTGAGSEINSSIHFVQLKDNKEKIYDSYLPDMRGYLTRGGVSIVGNIIASGADLAKIRSHSYYEKLFVDEEKRQIGNDIIYPDITGQEIAQMALTTGYESVSVEEFSDSPYRSNAMHYGLHSYKISKNKAFFNVRHFGHYSDIIEQRKIYTYEEKGKIIRPVTKQFVREGERIEPIESTAQNISYYSTSSLPFIDGGGPEYRTDDVTEVDTITIFAELPSSSIFST